MLCGTYRRGIAKLYRVLSGGCGARRLLGHLRPLCRHHGYRNGESAALVQFTVDLDRSAMRLSDPVHKAQPQAESPLDIYVGAGYLVEAVEDVREMLGRDAAAVVLDDQFHTVRIGPKRDANFTARRSKLDGVRDQVRNHALDLDAIDFGGTFRRKIGGETDASLLGGNLEMVDDLPCGGRQIEP